MRGSRFRAVLFDWGGTLMSEDGPADRPMVLWPAVRAIDGAEPTLAALASCCTVGVATNATVSSRTMIEGALARVALDRHVSHVFCYTELGVRKSEPPFWEHVLAALALPAAAVAMIGDDLEQDVLAPRARGIASAWFRPVAHTHDRRDVPVLRTLPEVLAFVAP